MLFAGSCCAPRKQRSCEPPPEARRRGAQTQLHQKGHQIVTQTQPRRWICFQDHARAVLRVGGQQSAQHRHLALPAAIAISHRSPQIDSVVYPYVVVVERCVSEHNLPQKCVKHAPLYAQNSIRYSRTSSNFMLIFLCRRLFQKKWMSKKMVVCSLG